METNLGQASFPCIYTASKRAELRVSLAHSHWEVKQLHWHYTLLLKINGKKKYFCMIQGFFLPLIWDLR